MLPRSPIRIMNFSSKFDYFVFTSFLFYLSPVHWAHVYSWEFNLKKKYSKYLRGS